MEIRKASETDLEALVNFNRLMAMETENKVLSEDTLIKGVEAVLKDAGKGFYLVACHENTPVGGLLITFEWSDWRNGFFWWIQSVYVKPEFRKKGVFSALFTRVKEMAGQRDEICGLRLYVHNTNEKAKNVYLRMGMKATKYELFEMDFN